MGAFKITLTGLLLITLAGCKSFEGTSAVAQKSLNDVPAPVIEEPGPGPEPALACNQIGVNQFFGCYYEGTNFQTLKATRMDKAINFDFGSGSPMASIPADGFSVKWIGDFDFESDTYAFLGRVDDGIRIYVDGKLVVDEWRNQAFMNYEGQVTLAKGRHRVEVHYYEANSSAGVSVAWMPAADVPAPTPTPTPTPAPDPGDGDDDTRPSTATYGARAVPRSKNPSSSDVFVSPNGSGSTCSQSSPCSLRTGISRGGHIWMMSGTYRESSQISLGSNKTLEALEPKKAIIDFGKNSGTRVTLQDNTTVRNIVVRNSGTVGLQSFGNNNLYDGVISEYNYGSGFANYPASGYSNLTNPTGGSFNTWKDSIGRYNSDNLAKCSSGSTNCGDSDSDGFSISAGRGNKIINCEANNNADDGIDVWRSYESTVTNSIARGNGRHPENRNVRIGNGNGFKMGSGKGPVPNRHRFNDNWAVDNISQTFSVNSGQGMLERKGNVCGENKTAC